MMDKYEPSAGLLDQTYQDLLSRRTALREKSRELVQAYPSQGFGVFDDDEYLAECTKYEKNLMGIQSQLELVNELLRPYEAEARAWYEAQEKRACDAMMRL